MARKITNAPVKILKSMDGIVLQYILKHFKLIRAAFQQSWQKQQDCQSEPKHRKKSPLAIHTSCLCLKYNEWNDFLHFILATARGVFQRHLKL